MSKITAGINEFSTWIETDSGEVEVTLTFLFIPGSPRDIPPWEDVEDIECSHPHLVTDMSAKDLVWRHINNSMR